MGRLVALLGDEHAIGPAPDLALVEELVARAAGSGLDVTLRLEGEREGLPAEVGETAYRVVQEGLTNALRYAAGAAVAVRVRARRRGPDRRGRERRDGRRSRRSPAPAPATGCAGCASGSTPAAGGSRRAQPRGDGWLLSARLPRRIEAGAGHPSG